MAPAVVKNINRKARTVHVVAAENSTKATIIAAGGPSKRAGMAVSGREVVLGAAGGRGCSCAG